MREMFDSVNPGHIPENAQMVAGYVDGAYKWSDAEWERFPQAVKVRIAVFHTTNDGEVLDVEPGNANPEQAVDWVLMRRKDGTDPTVYCSKDEWQRVKQAFMNRHVPEPHFWIADWNNNTEIPAGAVAHQYKSAGSYDVSSVIDFWPGVDAKPQEPESNPAPVQPVSDTPPTPAQQQLITQQEAQQLIDACNTFSSILQRVHDNLKV